MSAAGDANLTAKIRIVEENTQAVEQAVQKLKQLIIELKGVNAVANASQTSVNEFNEAIGGGLGALDNLTAKAKNVKNAFSSLNSEVGALNNVYKQLSSQMTSSGGLDMYTMKAKSAELATEKLGAQLKNLGSTFAVQVAAYSAAAISVFSLYNAYDNLEKIQLRVEKTALAAEKSQTRLASLQATYNSQLEKGNLTSEKAAVMNEKIANAQEQVRVSMEQAQIAAGDYNETVAGFVFQIVPFFVTAGASVITMMTTLKTAQAETTVATITLTSVTHGLSAAFKALMSSNVILLGITIAVSAALLAFSNNFMGFRDAVNNAGVALGRIFTPLKPLLELLGGINAQFTETTDNMNSTASEMGDTFSTMETEVGGSISSITDKVSEMSSVFDKSFLDVVQKIKRVTDKIKNEGRFEFPIDLTISEEDAKSVESELKKVLGKDKIEFTVTLPNAGDFVDKARTVSQAIMDIGKSTFESKSLLERASLVGGGNSADFVKQVFGFDDKTYAEFHNALNSIGPTMRDVNGNISITEGQFALLTQKLENAQISTVGLREKMEQFVTIVDSNAIPTLTGYLARTDEMSPSNKELANNISLLTGIFADNINTLFGVSNSYKSTADVLKIFKGELIAAGYPAKVIEEVMSNLGDILKTKFKEVNKSNKEFSAGLKEMIKTGSDIGDFARIANLGLRDVSSAYDTADQSVIKSMATFKAWATSEDTSAEQALKALQNMSQGHFVALGSMDEATKKSMEIIRKWFKSLSGDEQKAVLQDIAHGEFIPVLEKIDKALEDSMATLEDYQEALKKFRETNDTVTSAVEVTWDKYKHKFFEATNPRDIQKFIDQIDIMIDVAKKSNDIDMVIGLTMFKAKLEETKQTLKDASASQIELSNSTLEHARAAGVSAEVIDHYNQLLRDNSELTNAEILQLQDTTLARQEHTNALFTEEELQIRLQDARLGSIDSLKEMQLGYELQRQEQEQLLSDTEELITAYQIDVPEGFRLTAETGGLLLANFFGLEGAAKALDKALADAAGGLTAAQKSELDLTKTIEDNARALGVSEEALRRYNNQKNNLGIASKEAQFALMGETNAVNRSADAHKYNALTAQQMTVAEQSADARFKQFAYTVQVESVESTRYAKLLARALIDLGMSANKAYALVAQSISAGEQAFRHLSGVPGVEMPELDSEKGGGGGGSKKQKIDKKALREQAADQAIEEAGAVDHLVDKLIEETEAVHDLGLEVGISRKEMKEFAKDTDRFGIATERARIEMLKLIEAEAKHVDFLTNSNEKMKDYLRASIDGTLAANDFTREIRSNVVALESQRNQLLNISKLLGINLPASLEPTIDNLEDLIAASYGSEEAMDSLKDSVLEVGEFYRDVIADAKQAIEDAEFEEFVKKELLFENVGDEFFRNITRELQSEMKLDAIAEQMKKQLGLIQLNPDMFKAQVNPEELRSGVTATLQTIQDAIAGNERLANAWAPVVSALQNTLASPDIHGAMQEFAALFPNVIEPALAGVNFALQGIDTTINETFDDTANEQIAEQKKTVSELKDEYEDIYDELLDAAKASSDMGSSMSDAASSMDDMIKKLQEADPAFDGVNSAMGEVVGSGENMALGVTEAARDFSAAILGLPQDTENAVTSTNAFFGTIPISALQAAEGTDAELGKIAPAAETSAAPVPGIFSQAFLDASTQAGIHLAALVVFVNEKMSTMSTSVATYSNSMKINFVGAIGLMAVALTAVFVPALTTTQNTERALSLNTAAYMKSMQANVNIFAAGASKDLGGVSAVAKATQQALSSLSSNTATYMKSMKSNISSMASSAVTDFNKMTTAANKAAAALRALAAARSSSGGGGGGGSRSVSGGMKKIFGAAEGGTFMIGKETHLTVGEGNRPEMVSVMPLSSDYFRNNGLVDDSAGLFGNKKLNIQNPIKVTPPKSMDSRSLTQASSSRTITININQPIKLNDREIGRNIVSQTFSDVDNQH